MTPPRGLPHVVGGRLVEPGTGRPIVLRRDANGAESVVTAETDRRGLREAVRAARNAVAAWTARGAAGRAEGLFRLASEIAARRVELSALSAAGPEETAEDLARASDLAFSTAGWADKWPPPAVRLLDGPAEAAREPATATLARHASAGVAGLVADDAPRLSHSVCLALPALAACCPVALLATPASAWAALSLAELARAAGLPDGTLNAVVAVEAADHAGALASHLDVDGVAILTSDEALSTLLRREASGPERPLWIESPAAAERRANADPELLLFWLRRRTLRLSRNPIA